MKRTFHLLQAHASHSNAYAVQLEMLRRVLFGCCVGMLCVVPCGCGSRLPTVEGQVTLDDEPLADARIVFESPEKATAFAKTDSDGRYSAMTGSQQGMASGSYQVAISAYATADGGSESPIPILRTPKKYNDAETSGLTIEVQDGRNRDVNFRLQSQE